MDQAAAEGWRDMSLDALLLGIVLVALAIIVAVWWSHNLAAPTFCRRCGSRLVRETQRVGFDPRTGKPQTCEWVHCPNLTRPWGWDDHDCVPPPPRDRG